MAETLIHPSSVISPGARIGDGCRVGPFCYVGEHVVVGGNCTLHSHVVLDGHLRMGAGNEVYSFACLGKQTQDLKYKGDTTYVEIGDRNLIREYVTINSSTGGGNTTRLGSDCMIQSYCHIAHECQVGNHVVMSSGAMLSGHVEVGNSAIIGGYAGVVQFVRIGTMAMLGGFSKLAQDILPYCIAEGAPAAIRAVNKIGMDRNGKSRETIKAVTDAFRTIIRSGLTAEEAQAALRESYPDTPEVAEMLAFTTSGSRGLARPRRKGADTTP